MSSHSLEDVIWRALPSTAQSTPVLSGGWPRCSPQLPSSLIISRMGVFLSFKVVIGLVNEIPMCFLQVCLLLIWGLACVTGLWVRKFCTRLLPFDFRHMAFFFASIFPGLWGSGGNTCICFHWKISQGNAGLSQFSSFFCLFYCRV